jgi:hypothetical protein
VRELPKDYVPETAPAEGAAATEKPKATGGRKPKAKPEPQLSLAEDSPLPPTVPGGEATALEPAVAPVEKVEAEKPATSKPAEPGKPAQTKPAAAARAGAEDVRARTLALMDKLVRSGARKPDLPRPAKPKEFHGADSELTRIEDEALALAIEALRREQSAGAATPSPAPETK